MRVQSRFLNVIIGIGQKSQGVRGGQCLYGRQGLSRWRGGRFACTSLIRRWSLERLPVARYDEVNMDSDVGSISMSINNRLLAQLLSLQQLPTQSRFKSHSSTRPPQTPAA